MQSSLARRRESRTKVGKQELSFREGDIFRELPEPSRRVHVLRDGCRRDWLFVNPNYMFCLWVTVCLIELFNRQVINFFAGQLEKQIAKVDI